MAAASPLQLAPSRDNAMAAATPAVPSITRSDPRIETREVVQGLLIHAN